MLSSSVKLITNQWLLEFHNRWFNNKIDALPGSINLNLMQTTKISRHQTLTYAIVFLISRIINGFCMRHNTKKVYILSILATK